MNKLAPPRLFLLLLMLAIPLGIATRTLKETPTGFYVMGILLVNIGILLNYFGDQEFKIAETTIKPWEKPTRFVSGGVFKLTRNPMYLGMALILVSVAFFFSSIAPLATALVFIIFITKKYIKMEEQNMLEQFGNNYLKYKKRVRRWL